MKKLLFVAFLLSMSTLISNAQCTNYFTYTSGDTLTYNFIGESYYDSTLVQADSYFWDFGDGTTGEGQIVTHTFQSNGVAFYLVCLTTLISDPVTGDSCIAISCQEVWVYNTPDCQAWFFYYPTDSAYNPLTYQFIDESWGSPDNWAWDFGDGTTSSEQNPLHTYEEAGTYTVTFAIWDSAGTCQSTYTEEVYIGTNPWDCFNFFYYEYENETTLVFIGEAYYNGMIVEADSYFWDFGDGTMGEGQTVTHTFDPTPNEFFQVCLTTTIIDEATGDSCIAESCQEVWIGNQPDCQAWFYYYPADSMKNTLTYQFIDASIGFPDTWIWEFGDGITTNEQNPLHTYEEAGTYVVTLSIWDSAGTCQSTYTEEVYIGTNPWDCFNFFYYEYENETTLVFIGEAYYNGMIVEADSYFWDFGDGTTGEGQTVTHTFDPTPNEFFQVCLTTTIIDEATGDSCIAESCQEVWIGNQPDCQAWFFYYPADSMDNTLTYQFIDASIGFPDTWIWEFGDGITSNEQNPLHTYEEAGTYLVTLSISDSSGTCQSTYTEEVYIGTYPEECYNFFEYVIEDVMTVTFNGESYWGGMIIPADEYIWDFGDGTTGIGQTVTHIYEPGGAEFYTVCLTTYITDPATGDTCYAYSCKDIWLNYQTWNNLYGQIIIGNTFADIGQATLIIMDETTGEMYTMDVQPIDSAGLYQFFDVLPGRYYILAELLPGSTSYDSYLPTYYGDVLFWEDAIPIVLGDPQNPYDIHLIEAEGFNFGPGGIIGTVTEDNRLNGQGAGVTDVEILLMDQDHNGLSYRYSNDLGSFDFSDLAFGTYLVYPEMPGKVSYPALITIDEITPSATLDIVISGKEVNAALGLDEIEQNPVQIIGVFPNPAKDVVSLQFKVQSSKFKVTDCKLYVYDVTGKIVEELDNVDLDSIIKLDVSEYQNGIYSVVLRDSNSIYSREKFIIIH